MAWLQTTVKLLFSIICLVSPLWFCFIYEALEVQMSYISFYDLPLARYKLAFNPQIKNSYLKEILSKNTFLKYLSSWKCLWMFLSQLSHSLFCWFQEFCKNLTVSTWQSWLAKFLHLEICASRSPFAFQSFCLSIGICFPSLLSSLYAAPLFFCFCSNSMTPADISTFEFQVYL